MHRHHIVFSRLARSSGMPIAISKSVKLNSCIRMFVDVPNPLSTSLTGMVSSSILDVAHIMTPPAYPKQKRPRTMILKVKVRPKREPTRPIMLKYMIVFLDP